MLCELKISTRNTGTYRGDGMRIPKRKMFLFCQLVCLAAFSIAGCAQNGKSTNESEPSGPLLSIDPATVGSITGTVTIENSSSIMAAPTPSCGKGNGSDAAASANANEQNSELAKTVIYIKTGLARYRYQTPTDHAVLDQKGCTYVPHVIALMTGQPLEIRNSDPVAHNIHVLSKANRPWDHSEPAGVAPIMESFSKPELAVHVICKIHAGMSAYLFVFNHPYFAVPAPTGSFELKNIPPGTYTIEAWQEHLGTQDQTVTIGPKQSEAISFVFNGKNPRGD